MRFNSGGEVARNHEGRAIASWSSDNARVFQEPVSVADDTWRLIAASTIDGVPPRELTPDGANAWAAGGGQWMSRLDGRGLRGSMSVDPAGRVGDISPDGDWCYFDAERTALTIGTVTGSITSIAVNLFGDVRLWTDGAEPCVAYSSWVGDDPLPRACLRTRWGHDIPAQSWGPAYTVLAYREPDGTLWVLYQTDAHGLILHPANDRTRGYRMGQPGAIFNPDLLPVDGGLLVGWSVDAGEFTQDTRRVTLGRDMVSLVMEPPVTPPVEPPVEPPTPPIEGPVTAPAHIEAEFKKAAEVLREFASVYPVPQGDGSDEWVDEALRWGWMAKAAATVRARLGEQWGRKRASESRPVSKESLALNRDGLHGWDLLLGASSGRPVLNLDDPSYHDLIAEGPQVFVPVEPFDHLAALPVSNVQRPPLPFVAAASSFDWHLGLDFRWLGFLEAAGIRTLRLVVASVFREGATLEQGRAMLADGLEALRQRGFTAVVTINTDTGARGLSRGDVSAHTAATSDLMARYLDVVLAARLCNENSHAVEASYMTDPEFLLTLDWLVDSRIPLAWGANHGGEPVSALLAGGSWIAFHADRSKTPEENAAIMRAAQERFGKPVVDDEPIGIYREAQPGRRVNDPAWAERQAKAAAGLGGTTLHLDAGIEANVDDLDDVQREAARVFGAVFAGQEIGGTVTVDQIAKVFAGAFFEDVSKLLKLTGTVEERRAKVHDWTRAKCRVINQAYLDIFKRPADLEGYGSRLLLFVEHGWHDDQLRRALQDAFNRGDR